MYVNKIKNKMFLWKSTENFPSFSELKKLAEQYYLNTLRLIFLTKSGMFFDVDFTFEKNLVAITPYILFSRGKKIGTYPEEYNLNTFSNYKFNKKMKEEYFTSNASHSSFIKYCLMSDFYNYLIDSIDI